MIKYLGKRMIEAVLVLLAITLVVFILFKSIPGDFLSDLEMNPTVAKDRIEELREDLGLNRPIVEQYLIWIGNLSTGDFGYSFSQRRPAGALIWERLGRTLFLACFSFLITLLISIPLGVGAAFRLGSWFDRLVIAISLVSLSFPAVLAGVFFLYFAYITGWFPIGGADTFLHAVLPALTLAVPTTGFYIRSLRLEVLDSLGQPYVVAAAAKGLPKYRVLWHAFRTAVNPLISLSGVTLGGLLGGAVVVEKVFSWPGLGALTVDSILSRDLYVALDCVLIAAVLVILANTLSDVILAWNDPRVRYS